MLVISPPQMGKSTFCLSVLKKRHQIFQSPHTKLIFCSPHFTNMSESDEIFQKRVLEAAQDMPIIFLDHMITMDELLVELPSEAQKEEKIMLIIDDLSLQASASPLTHSLFTKISSHSNCDIIFTCHSANYKDNGRYFATIFGCANYIVLLRNLADGLSLSRLSR